MKKIILLLLFAFTFASGGFAQISNPADTVGNKIQSIRLNLKRASPFFISIHGGYGIAIGSSYNYFGDNISSISVTKDYNTAPTTNIHYKANNKGLGGGYRFGIGLSYIINDFINVGIEADYYESNISKVRDSSYHLINGRGNIKNYSYDESRVNSYHARLLTLSPNIIFKAISRPKFYIYNRIGGVFGLHEITQDIANNINEQTTLNNGDQMNTTTITVASYNHIIKMPSLGFTAGIGIQYKIIDAIRIYLELQTTHFVLVPTQQTMTSYTVDGENKLKNVPTPERYIYYKDEYDSNGETDRGKPSIAPTQKIPITYAGIQLGVSFRF